MAEKSFGVKEINLIGASGTPTIESPNNLNLNAVNVAISTNATIGGNLTVSGTVGIAGTLTYEDVTNVDAVGIITARDGIFIPDNKKIHLGDASGSGDLQIYHDSSNSYIKDQGTGQLVIDGNAVILQYSASTKLETTNTGAEVTGTLTADGARFTDDGTSGPTVSIQTDDANPYALNIGNQSYSADTAYGLNFYNNNAGEGYFRFVGNSAYKDYHFSLHNNSTNKLCLKFEADDQSVELYAEGNKKLETTSSGVTVTGTVTATSFSGSGANLTGIAVTEAPVTDYTISANGSSAYRFHGGGVDETANSPDLYLIRGQKYRFNNTTGGGHPFAIRVSNGGSAYTDGVSGSQSGIQFFTVPYAAPASLVYQCTIHSGMIGNIYIRGGASTATISNNANNRVITGGSGGNLNAESNMTFDGDDLIISHSGLSVTKFESTDNHSRLRISSGDSSLAQLEFADQSDADAGEIRYDNGNDAMTIHVGNNTERLRIDSNGRIILGSTSNTAFATGQAYRLFQIGQADGGWINLARTGVPADGNHLGAIQGFTKSSDGNYHDTTAMDFKADGTISNSSKPSRIEFYTTAASSTTKSERLRINSNGFVTNTFKPVRTAQNAVVTDTTNDRFVIGLPSTSRMFRLTGSFNFDGSGTGTIWADFGDWSDSHSPNLEGFANVWRNAAGGPQYQDNVSGRYYRVATPFDYASLEVTYDVLITTKAFNGGARPGAHGHIRWTWSGIGNALTVFSFQDTAASSTDRLNSFAWDIDGVTGSSGTGRHHYIIEEYPLT